MFVGWEGVGLCSYLLIGFWYSDRHNADAGKKAFIVNRIGDFGFLLGHLPAVLAFADWARRARLGATSAALRARSPSARVARSPSGAASGASRR